MRLEQLSMRQQRILASAILMVVIVIAYTVLVVPLWGVRTSYENKLQHLAQRMENTRAILSEGKRANEQLRQLALAEKRYGYYLENNKPTLAAAELQRRVKQTVEQLGGSIVSSLVLGEQEDRGLQNVVLRVNLRLDLPTLQKILHALETRPPVLVLNNVTITAHPSGSSARWRGSTAQQMLDVSMDVVGYTKVGE